MKNVEAKFVLAAYRPSGRDATDPFFAEPLDQARRDPELKAWLGAQIAFDSLVAEKLQLVQPPPGLRDTILAGVRVSRRKRSWWLRPRWLAFAAAFLLVAIAGLALRPVPPQPRMSDLARFALEDTALHGGDHLRPTAAAREIAEGFALASFGPGSDADVDLDRLRAAGCRAVRIGGREVFEICFGRDREFHLYVGRREDFTGPASIAPEFATEGRFSAGTWSNSRLAFSLVSPAGSRALGEPP